MAKTPPHLRRFGIPAETSARKVWRGWLAFRNKEKRKEFLSVVWVMQASGALEQYGSPSKEVEARSQKIMARMLGIDKSTFNRRLGQFSAPDGRWDADRRRRHSAKMKAAAAARVKLSGACTAAGDGVDSLPSPGSTPSNRRGHRTVQRLNTFFNKNSMFGQAQLYSLSMPDSLKPRLQKKASKTKDAELLAQAFGTEWFDPTRQVNGYKSVAGWIWDQHLPDVEKCSCQAGQMGLKLAGDGEKDAPRCARCDGRGVLHKADPMPDYGRVLMTFLLLKGLEQYGVLEITQEAIGEALGMDVNTVAKYEDKWEALMIIRCIPGEVTRDAAGAVVHRAPHKILWLPDRILDEDIAQREYERFQALQAQVEARAFEKAAAIHVELLKAWRGKEHSLKVFWSEMRRQLAAANIHRGVIDALFPFYRE